MSSNNAFRDFMLKGAQISEEEYKASQANILGDGATGAKMRKFLAYALNNPNVKPGTPPSPTKLDEEILKNFKSSVILPSTPLMPQEEDKKE